MNRLAMPVILCAAAVGLTAAAPQSVVETRQAERLALRLAGLTPGTATSCLPRDRVTQTKGYNGTILFIQGRNKVWRNDTSGGCEGLNNEDIMVTRSSSGQFCRGDIVETRSRSGGHFTGTCALGSFVPYSK